MELIYTGVPPATATTAAMQRENLTAQQELNINSQNLFHSAENKTTAAKHSELFLFCIFSFS